MYRLIFKRLFDIILSLILIIVTLPIMAVLAIIIRMDGGPAIFVQKRSGKNNKVFKIFKFRSMSVNNDVHDFKKEDAITPFGQFMKDTSLDELPQLFNILKGDMSFIGPRPWIVDYSMYFTKQQMKRLNVRPGLTGLAQCSGRNNISIKEKINFDVEYVENLSLLMDIKVFFKTIKAVITKNGSVSSKLAIKRELEELKEQQQLPKTGTPINITDMVIKNQLLNYRKNPVLNNEQ